VSLLLAVSYCSVAVSWLRCSAAGDAAVASWDKLVDRPSRLTRSPLGATPTMHCGRHAGRAPPGKLHPVRRTCTRPTGDALPDVTGGGRGLDRETWWTSKRCLHWETQMPSAGKKVCQRVSVRWCRVFVPVLIRSVIEDLSGRRCCVDHCYNAAYLADNQRSITISQYWYELIVPQHINARSLPEVTDNSMRGAANSHSSRSLAMGLHHMLMRILTCWKLIHETMTAYRTLLLFNLVRRPSVSSLIPLSICCITSAFLLPGWLPVPWSPTEGIS